MTSRLDKRLKDLESEEIQTAIKSIRRGMEREGLRVNQQGYLADTPHPLRLGSKLTHPSITTDFSEAQLELITSPSSDIRDSLEELQQIHQFVYTSLGKEVLWSASMPCVLSGKENIPLARYGHSNLGKLKTTYRNGLGHRYGRLMQTICAIHYNFSLPASFWQIHKQQEACELGQQEFANVRYFDLMRNFRRISWLPIYLFGSSPVVCNSFVEDQPHSLEPFDSDSMYSPFSTSLRNGDLGYQSDIQSELLNVSYNSLADYIQSLARGITTPHPKYVAIGAGKEDIYSQVNPNILQSEAEFYTTVRAKRLPPPGHNFLQVLMQGGVEYIEVRLLDVNPFLPLGIDLEQICFLDTILLYCLIEESPLHDKSLCESVATNVRDIVYFGRKKGLQLIDNGKLRTFKDWGNELLTKMKAVAELLDRIHNTSDYVGALNQQLVKINDPDATPSAQILAQMTAQGIPFFRFAMNQAIAHRQYLSELSLSMEVVDHFSKLAAKSLDDQRRLEQADALSFDAYLDNIADSYQAILSTPPSTSQVS